MEKNNVIYVTYDINLKNYLSMKGVNDILYGLHPKTKRMFWVYKRSSELQALIDEWFK